MPLGAPSTPGIANSSRMRVITRMAADRSAGMLNGSTTLKMVRDRLAPEITEASSRLASMRCITAWTVRNT